MIDQKVIIRNLAIGFIPILVFLLADAIFGLTVGLLMAIGVGIFQFGYTLIHEKRIDRFILFDISLILILGIISLTLQDDIFFKLKPALIELILLVLLAFMAFPKSSLLIKMTGRYMKGVELTEEQLLQMRIMMRRMFYILLIHTMLIIYSAFYMSTAEWGFISGGLFYILMGLLLGYEFIKARFRRKKIKEKMEAEEWFDIVTQHGKIIGKAPRSAVHGNPELIHSVVHVHILNSKGDLYLQKRAPTKRLYPEKWDTAVGGHVSSGETVEHALVREAEEELGLSMVEFKPLFRYVHRNEYESELVHGFWVRNEGSFFINKREISEGKFWTISDIQNNMGKEIFTPNFEEEFELLKKILFPKIR